MSSVFPWLHVARIRLATNDARPSDRRRRMATSDRCRYATGRARAAAREAARARAERAHRGRVAGDPARHRRPRAERARRRAAAAGRVRLPARLADGRLASESARARGLGPARYVVLQAALELARRHYQELLRARLALAEPDARRANSCRCGCATCPTRCFAACCSTTTTGSSASRSCSGAPSTARAVHPREVVKQALARNALGVILAHNHPSGVAEPSQADEQMTRPPEGGPGAGRHPAARPPGRRRRGLRVLRRARACCKATCRLTALQARRLV